MYTRWAEKHGWNKRVIEKHTVENGGVHLAILEIESEYIYGYLSGEKGTHVMIDRTLDNCGYHEVVSIFLLPLVPHSLVERAFS
jgi:PCRF domain